MDTSDASFSKRFFSLSQFVVKSGLLSSPRDLTEKQHERMRTDDRCSGVYFVSRLSQSCASQVLSVSRCKKEVCNMHAHAIRKGTGGLWSPLPVSSARCPFCLSYSLRSSPTGLCTPAGSRRKQLSCTKKSVIFGLPIFILVFGFCGII